MIPALRDTTFQDISISFKDTGKTQIILESPSEEKEILNLTIERNSKDIKKEMK